MFRLHDELKVYVHRDAVDFRKSINGLAAIVERSMKLDPFAQAVYVFSNQRRDRIKILLWDRNGFWLLMKRLEQDRFVWPRKEAVLKLRTEQLHWLLDGIDIEAMRAHPTRYYRNRHFMAAWTELTPVYKVMPVTSSGGDYFGHTECETIDPQGPSELRTGVPTASRRRGKRAGYFGGEARAGARTESQYGVQVASATAGWSI